MHFTRALISCQLHAFHKSIDLLPATCISQEHWSVASHQAFHKRTDQLPATSISQEHWSAYTCISQEHWSVASYMHFTRAALINCPTTCHFSQEYSFQLSCQQHAIYLSDLSAWSKLILLILGTYIYAPHLRWARGKPEHKEKKPQNNTHNTVRSGRTALS